MAEDAASALAEDNQEDRLDSSADDMDLAEESATDGAAKRPREDEEPDGVSKKPKVDKSAEEERLERKLEEEGEGGSEEDSGRVGLGPKSFGSSVEMFDYFYNFLHHWPPNINVNKYEHMVLLELLKKGHLEPEKKIGCGIHAFQVRYHPTWKSRCFFLIRDDETVDDFSFRKCVDKILPLPEDMKIKPGANRSQGGRGGKGHGGKSGGRGRRGRARGRGGKARN